MHRDYAMEIISTFSSKIPSDKIPVLKSALRNAPDSAYNDVFAAKTYSSTTTLLLSIFLVDHVRYMAVYRYFRVV